MKREITRRHPPIGLVTRVTWRNLVSRSVPVYICDLTLQAQDRASFRKSIKLPIFFRLFRYYRSSYGVDIRDFESVTNYLRKKVKYRPRTIVSLLARFERTIERALQIGYLISEVSPNDCSDQELLQIIHRLHSRMKDVMAFGFIPHLLNNVLEDEIVVHISRKARAKKQMQINEILELISPGVRKTWATSENERILSLAHRIRKDKALCALFTSSRSDNQILEALDGNDRIKSELIALSLDFGWLRNPYWVGKSFGIRWYLKKVREHLTKAGPYGPTREGGVKNNLRAKSALASIRGARIQLDCLKKLSYLHTHRAESIALIGWRVRALYREIGRRLGISFNSLMSLTHQEIIYFLENRAKSPARILTKRRKGCALLLLKERVYLLSGNELRLFASERKGKSKRVPELVGRVAWQAGKVQGFARVVTGKRDLARVKLGEILVTKMTTVDMMGAVTTAKAIVTDEGGITSHAAINARKFKIPTIIATGNATEMIKSGDLLVPKGGINENETCSGLLAVLVKPEPGSSQYTTITHECGIPENRSQDFVSGVTKLGSVSLRIHGLEGALRNPAKYYPGFNACPCRLSTRKAKCARRFLVTKRTGNISLDPLFSFMDRATSDLKIAGCGK
jgi:phosphohistidine swiveling domain-containing protein